MLWALAFVMLMAGFHANLWHAAPDAFFHRHQRDSQSLVVGRLVKSEQDGLFSAAALTGRVLPPPTGMGQTEYQYLAYERSLPFERYRPYSSQPGGQALLFAVMDRPSGFPNRVNLLLFQALTAGLTAAALATLILWFRISFGLVVYIVLLLTTLSFQWLTVFGRNLWWVLWVFYLPMLVFCALSSWRERISGGLSFFCGFFPMLLKGLLTGFEYFTTTVVMMTTPLVFAAIARQWPLRVASGRIGAALAGGGTALIATFLVLSVQIGLVRGEPLAGLRHVVLVLKRRAHGNPADFAEPAIQDSLSAGVLDVLSMYLNGTAVTTAGLVRDLQWALPKIAFTFQHLLLLALGCSALLLVSAALRHRVGPADGPGAQADVALIAVTWVAVLAPLSWIILFKAHSQIHTHINQITWHMPFTFFAMAIVGVAVDRIVALMRR